MISMLRRTLLVATVLAATPVFAEDAPKAASGKDYTIIKMGDTAIKNSEVIEIWKGLFPAGSAPDFSSFDENIRQNVLRGLVSERLIYQEALKAGYDKNAEVKKRIENMQKQVIMQSFMEEKAKDLVTDKELRAAYDEKVKAVKGQQEIKARHILVSSEEEAKKVEADLKKAGISTKSPRKNPPIRDRAPKAAT